MTRNDEFALILQGFLLFYQCSESCLQTVPICGKNPRHPFFPVQKSASACGLLRPGSLYFAIPSPHPRRGNGSRGGTRARARPTLAAPCLASRALLGPVKVNFSQIQIILGKLSLFQKIKDCLFFMDWRPWIAVPRRESTQINPLR